MIRVYFDWNVINQMKNGSHLEIRNILDTNTSLLMFYSTAHIGDIYASYSNDENQLNIIKEDLKYLSDVTKNNCLSVRDGNTMNVDNTNPKELFDQRIYSADVGEGFSLDSLMESMEDVGMGEIGKIYVDLLKNMPLDVSFIQALSNPETAESIDLILPGLKKNPTMEGFFKSFGKMIDNMNNSTGYGDLRQMYQKALQINPAKAFNWADPFKEHDKILKSKFNENTDNVKQMLNKDNNKYAPTWYNQVINTYINLDMSGYKQDKIEVKNRNKKTFKNTTEDAFHTAFSSMCDIYVLNDKKSYFKAIETFKHLNINTKVLNPEEFVKYYNNFLKFEQGYNTLYLIIEHIKLDTPYVNEENNIITKTYFTDYYFFDFFNKIYTVYYRDDNNIDILLSKDKPTNGKFTLFEEVKKLVNRLILYFGNDVENIGEFSIEEFESFNDWTGRTWKLEQLDLRLIQNNGFYQLYLVLSTAHF